MIKKEEMIPGYWYMGKGLSFDWLFKFSHIDGGEVYSTHSCTPKDRYYHNKVNPEITSTGTKTDIREATKEEVANMWPNEVYTNQSSLSDNWYIKPCLELVDWAKEYNKNRRGGDGCNVSFSYREQYYYLKIPGNLRLWNISSIRPKNRVEITWEQFKKQYLNTSTKTEMNKTGKIIGYKTPMDLFEGEIRKGTIFKQLPTRKRWGIRINDTETYSVPLELIKDWEPVYEEDVFKEMSYVVRVYSSGAVVLGQIDGGDWLCLEHHRQEGLKPGDRFGIDPRFTKERYNLRLATSEEIRQHTSLNIGGYQAEFKDGYVKFGCKTITAVEIEALIRVGNWVRSQKFNEFTFTPDQINTGLFGRPVNQDILPSILKKLARK